jgi:uncharacterized UBP type Zn finger protein
MAAVPCTHLDQIRITDTDKDYCEDCVAISATWVHLRLCLSCGHVGCCDSSPNRHASKHARKTSHPLVIEPGESWVWCYVDQTIAGELP